MSRLSSALMLFLCYDGVNYVTMLGDGKTIMSPLDKMWASFIAIGLMVLASLLITFARNKTTGIIRFVLSLVAFLMFIPIFIYMVVSLL